MNHLLRRLRRAAALLLVLAPATAQAQAPSTAALIEDAVHVLPADLRAGATVVTYDAATGARQVLRPGTNFMECQPTMADGFTRCYHTSLGPRRDLEAKLRAEKKTAEQSAAAVAAAVKAGTLPPGAPAMMSYRGYAKRDRIQNLWVISLPNRTPESVGVSIASQRDAALEGHGLPWMMLPGTPGAHVMIPINPAVTTPAVTDVAPTEAEQAVLPLPDDLKAGAGVYKYDPTTGERVTLKKGANAVECTPRGADGFTWCYNAVTAARRDLSAKLRAQGKSDADITAAVAAATKAGTLAPTPFGTMSYRLYGKKDRIQLLWVLSVPGATPESIGVSTGSQRDAALAGHGAPWLMLAGTPGAHIMIPINK